MKIFIAILLIVHGLITAAFSTGSFNPWPPVPNPAFLSKFPLQMGQSWLLTPSGLDRSPLGILGGIFYLVGGLALIGAGLGLLGWLVPAAFAPTLAVAGAGLCLFMLLVYFHPFYLVGIASNAAVLASVLWLHWPTYMSLPA